MPSAAEKDASLGDAARLFADLPRAVWAIAGGAVVLRIVHAWLMSGDPLYEYPVIDPMDNLERARYLAEVSWLGPPEAYWKPPLYDYFLALHHMLFGGGLWPSRISQILLDGGSCVLAFALARRLISRRAGLGVAAALALWGPLIYFSSVHVSSSLVVFLELAMLLLALRAQRVPSRGRWIDVGLALGLLALARAESLLLAPWLAGWLWWSLRRYSRRDRAVWLAALAIGVLVAIAPVTLRNALYARDAVLISANGGVNLYIGTEPEYRGVIGVRPGPEWEMLIRAPIDVGYESPSEQSAYYVRKALASIARDPGRWIAHSARKLLHVWHGRELASNRDIYLSRGESFVLSALLWRTHVLCFPFGLLAPIALVGMAVSWRERRESRFLIGLVAIQCAAMVLFFVTGRFRLPMLPVLAVFGAEAVTWSFARVRDKQFRALALVGAIALALFALTNCGSVLRSDPDFYEPKLRAEEHYFRGTVLGHDMGRIEEGKLELHAALELEPEFVAVYYNLAQLYEKSGEDVAALRLFRKALAITERSPAERYTEAAIRAYLHKIAERIGGDAATPEPLRRFAAGVGCLDAGDWDCAIDEFQAASVEEPRAEIAPLLGLAYFERGRENLRAERDAAARSDLAEASALRPHDAQVYVELGVALARAGLLGKARSAFGQFRVYDLPRGEYYRSAIASADAGDRAIALSAARTIARQFPRDRLAREALEHLSK